MEAFDVGMINYAKYLIKKGRLFSPYYFNLIIGNIACAQPTLLHVGMMINDIPERSVISLGGIGNAQLPMNCVAVSMGYGVRIGLEDNIWYDDARTVLATNKTYLERIHNVIRSTNREMCGPSELRKKLGLKSGYGEYGC